MEQVVLTGDGSATVFHSDTGEHYHSTFGAITESTHVFITNGFNTLAPEIDPVNILEVGFGTGLNAMLTLIEAGKQSRTVCYDALEPFPLEQETTRRLNYPEILGGAEMCKHFTSLHKEPSDIHTSVTPWFSILRIRKKLEDAILPDKKYHLVYFDAFSPNVQPELWGTEIFSKLFASLQDGGSLSTYCSKGAVFRAMKESGFLVGKLPGPPGKRHILRGWRKAI